MDCDTFRALNLHPAKCHYETDNPKTPYIVTAKLVERDRTQLFGCSFNRYLSYKDTPVVATCGGRRVHAYEVPLTENSINLKMGYEVSSSDEDLYTVCWALDTFEVSRFNEGGAHRVVTGGAGSIIYVIDAQTGQLINRLQSVGGAINELRTSPANSSLVACAAKDRTVRIFHIRNDTCLISIGGMDCHRDQILSVDWGFHGDYVVSCALDHLAMKFDLSEPYIVKHIKAACKKLSGGNMNILDQHTSLDVEATSNELRPLKIEDNNQNKIENYQAGPKTSVLLTAVGELGKPAGCMVPIFYPNGTCSDLHEDYVDCIRVLPGTPYMLSKGCGTEKAISLWRFGVAKGLEDRKTHFLEQCTTKIMTLHIPNGDVWFTRFEVDPMRRWVVVGGSKGRLNFFDLTLKRDQDPVMSIEIAKRDVRNVSFSAYGRVVIAVCDPGVVVRLDRVSSTVDANIITEALKK